MTCRKNGKKKDSIFQNAQRDLCWVMLKFTGCKMLIPNKLLTSYCTSRSALQIRGSWGPYVTLNHLLQRGDMPIRADSSAIEERRKPSQRVRSVVMEERAESCEITSLDKKIFTNKLGLIITCQEYKKALHTLKYNCFFKVKQHNKVKQMYKITQPTQSESQRTKVF